MSRRRRIVPTLQGRSADSGVRIVGGAILAFVLLIVVIALVGDRYGRQPRPITHVKQLQCDHIGKAVDCHPRWQDYQ